MPHHISSGTPTPIRVEPVTISRGAIRLAGLLETPALTAAGPQPLVILMHGITGTKEDPVVAAVAEALHARGVTTLRFDFNGHGASTGDPVDMTVPNEIEDAHAVYRYGRALADVSTISLAGHSQGGVVAGMLAGELESEIRALVLMAPAGVLKQNCLDGNILGATIDPADIPDRIDLPGTAFTVGREYVRTAQSLPVYETSARFPGSVCIIHGENDDVVPPAASRDYQDLHPGRSTLHVLPGQNHGFDLDPAEPASIAADFLAGLRGPPPGIRPASRPAAGTLQKRTTAPPRKAKAPSSGPATGHG